MNYHSDFGFQKVITHNTKILSVGTYLPNEVLKSDHMFEAFDSEKNYGIKTTWMSKEMGIKERRVSEPGTLPSQLAIPAARRAIENCPHLNPDEIDLVIFCGIERDQAEPATAHTIQSALGLKANHAFDVSNACFGFMHGIEVANHFIKSGATKYALVVTGEVPSRILRAAMNGLNKGMSRERAMDVIGALSVGDAGGAVVLGLSGYGENCGFELFNTRTDSSHLEKCFYRVNPDGSIDGQMKMGPIVGASIWMHKKIINDTLSKLGWDNFDWVLSHQTGKRPFEKFTAMSTVPAKRMIRTYHKLGNIASATFPLNYEKLLKSGKVRQGDRIGGIHSGSGLVVGEFGYRV
ncbi:3-oxoacyl-[acyl-carrier-protein] synthase 3 [Arenicella chitinivorans]|uniref:3-oxoacyl-[acyl-carrier-protein] synthase 3 n=1 Tax=Arenicella chitinivorans TaxID=1329800 RepID=A0A918RSD9_9GAMM|nr:ketoacyl-ACP synthase III [Arenicella chitinivorans]GHA10538.1 3-oxoacyl-[acyl-carrier-protein] synthase 3 [Arenicella chitinivorans]